ncbi:glutamate receptor 1-like [Macrobrachium nipponense]|uniref:glutamate receptor 1-like n=1 Tax=Macrobrachium nipponense TaxID=159736 RepID=UPI0030C82FF1
MSPNRTHIRIAAETWVPYTIVTDKPDGTLEISGPMGHVVNMFAQFYGFDYTLIRPPDGLWGAKQPDGSWNGMMGMVDRKEVEFAVGPFTITPERETACDFSRPVHSDNLAILMIRPGLENDVGGFLKPFTYKVWILIVASALCVAIIKTLVTKCEEVMYSFKKTQETQAFHRVLGNLVQEGSEWMPMSDSGRILLSAWLIATIVFSSLYSGTLTAMLTVPRVVIPIDSLADLVSQDRLPWRLEAGSMMPKFLMESGDPVRMKVVTHVSGTIPDCWAAREAIARGEYAALCDETSMKKSMAWDFSTTGRCHLYIAKQYVFTNAMMAMPFQVNSSYVAKINRIIGIIMESGLLDMWMGAELTNTSQCLRPPSSDKRDGISALNLEAFYGIFIVLSMGKFPTKNN